MVESLTYDCSLLFGTNLNTFCKENEFTPSKISILIGICHHLVITDFHPTSDTTLSSSFQLFKKCLVNHCIERPPVSVGILSKNDMEIFLEYVLSTYYRHFQLYKSIFTPQNHVCLQQMPLNDIVPPKKARSLMDAAMVLNIITEMKTEE